MRTTFLSAIIAFATLASAHGQILTYSFSGGAIPDDSASGGLTLVGLVPDGAPVIGKVEVALSISGVGAAGAYNGDLFAYLRHEDPKGAVGYAVLLNRPDATSDEPFGYGDNGLNVTFDDQAPLALDIHNYRRVVAGNDATALPSPGVLDGVWKSDGREADPAVTLDVDPRTATLDVFFGLGGAGYWTLYVQDLSGGGVAKVDFWNLLIHPQAVVPEPIHGVAVVGLALGGFALWRRRRQTSNS